MTKLFHVDKWRKPTIELIQVYIKSLLSSPSEINTIISNSFFERYDETKRTKINSAFDFNDRWRFIFAFNSFCIEFNLTQIRIDALFEVFDSFLYRNNLSFSENEISTIKDKGDSVYGSMYVLARPVEFDLYDGETWSLHRHLIGLSAIGISLYVKRRYIERVWVKHNISWKRVEKSDLDANAKYHSILDLISLISLRKSTNLVSMKEVFVKAKDIDMHDMLEENINYQFSIMKASGMSVNGNTIDTNKTIGLPKQYSYILAGPPGTGKSTKLNNLLSTHNIEACNKTRIVGHAELTSIDFIGTYRPINKGDGVKYAFVPGPFSIALKKALMNYPYPNVFIYEELNRSNAVSVFADFFQSLDRSQSGWSIFPFSISNAFDEFIKENLSQEMLDALSDGIRLPPNFAIWATMNTADQGVFPLDTAFKRRWSFDYLGVDDGAEVWSQAPWNPELRHCGGVTWQGLRRAINQKLTEANIDEDRQLGPFFLSETELLQEETELLKAVVHKVVAYLRDDVMRYEPERLFAINLPFSQLRSGLLSTPHTYTLLQIFGLLSDPVQESLTRFLAAYQQAPGAQGDDEQGVPGAAPDAPGGDS